MLGTQVKGGSASADELHRGAVVVDARQPASVGKDQFTLQYADLLRRRGLTGLGVGLSGYEVRQILRSVDSFLELIAQNPGSLTLATRASHIRRAKQEGKLALFFATSRVSEGINALEDFRAMYRVGVREVQVTYQYMNAMGCGCGERVDAGLSKFGLKAVEEMNRLGILVDVAHCGVKTFADVVRVSQAPVIYSHGATRALRDHIRNLADDQIEMLAEKGGMVGIAASSHFLKERGTIEGT
ncbi:MAG: membrane dipeptidase, partial [Acidobacteria bacterium]|nr:membrane dipeptidase [Acidobacteriota bacterium]